MVSSLLKFVPTVDRITIESNFPLESTINPFNASVTGIDLKPPTLFNYEPLPSPQVSEATITLKYDRAGYTVLVLEFLFSSLTVGSCIEIRAFGQVVISTTARQTARLLIT